MNKFENSKRKFGGSEYIRMVVNRFEEDFSKNEGFGVGRRGLHPNREEGFVYVGGKGARDMETQLLYGEGINFPLALVLFDHQQKSQLIQNPEGYVRMFLPYDTTFRDRFVDGNNALNGFKLLCLVYTWAKENRLESVHPNGDEQDICEAMNGKFFVLRPEIWQPSGG